MSFLQVGDLARRVLLMEENAVKYDIKYIISLEAQGHFIIVSRCHCQRHQYHDHFQPRYEERLAVSVTNLAKTSIDADKGLKVNLIFIIAKQSKENDGI